eukprot:GHUV01035375.1.p1 GENE.GHUV01035375.1~~GHUV01035375.1.p1  ORF type:complete len:120 (+),score=9.25 GHUV01035375.1:325-684(+)
MLAAAHVANAYACPYAAAQARYSRQTQTHVVYYACPDLRSTLVLIQSTRRLPGGLLHQNSLICAAICRPLPTPAPSPRKNPARAPADKSSQYKLVPLWSHCINTDHRQPKFQLRCLHLN